MASFRSVAHPVVNAFALIVAVAAVTIWSARMEHRVSGLEAAVQAAPSRPALSPQEACANLAIRVADALQRPGNNAEMLRQLLHDAGCPAALPGK